MKIINLEAENFKRLVAVDITPENNIVLITGKNAAGKSSVLDSLIAVFKGSRNLPEEPIRRGCDKGGIKIDLGDYQLIRNFTKKGNYLKIISNGQQIKSPQKFLDSIVGAVSFDPLEFINEKNQAKQRTVLFDLLEIDLEPLNTQVAEICNERMLMGRQVRDLEGELSGIPKPDFSLSLEKVDVTDLNQQISHAHQRTLMIQETQLKIEALKTRHRGIRNEIDELQERITDLQKQAKAVRADGEQLEDILITHPPISVTELTEQFEDAKQINDQVAEAEKWKTTKSKLDKRQNEYQNLTIKIENAKGEKTRMLTEKRMPIEGLTITESNIFYNDIPLSQISDSEGLMVSLAISMALNPTLRVLRIKEGSLLDDANLKTISKVATANDFQIWIEKVAEHGNGGIFITEGRVENDKD